MEQQLTPEIAQLINNLQSQAEAEQMRRLEMEKAVNNSGYGTKDEGNLIEYQLDLSQELNRIYHLLCGHIVKITPQGEEWSEPNDDRLKIFSDYGVKQIMNIIQFYVNKNTLLSFYDDATIKWKVKDFGNELNDLILNRYEAFFYYPTPEELFEKYYNLLSKNKDKFPHILDEFGNINIEKLYWKCVRWSEDELENKIAHYPMIVLSLVDTVHSTYMRAYGGKERQSLRERLNINQNATQFSNQIPMPELQKKGGWNPFRT